MGLLLGRGIDMRRTLMAQRSGQLAVKSNYVGSKLCANSNIVMRVVRIQGQLATERRVVATVFSFLLGLMLICVFLS